jgi:hypothetical protein
MFDGRCTLIDQEAVWQEAQELSARRLAENAGVYRSAAKLETPIRRMHKRINGGTAGCCS